MFINSLASILGDGGVFGNPQKNFSRKMIADYSIPPNTIGMKICLAQLNPVIGELTGNTVKVIDAIKKAKKEGAELVVFPEMTLCGYSPEDLLLHKSFMFRMEAKLNEVIEASKGISVIVGLIRYGEENEVGEKPLFNSAAIITDGKLQGFYDKQLLPTYDVFTERRYFSRGTKSKVWEIAGKKVGVIICEDMWQCAGYELSGCNYPWDPVRDLAPHKPDVLVNLTASPFCADKFEVRVKVCQAAASILKCPVVYVCQVGANNQLVFDGYSLVVEKDQTLRQVAKGFEEDSMMADTGNLPPPMPFLPDVKTDVYRALVLGIRDYFAKSHFEKALIGLSGGIDSSVAACIAVDALGAENVMGISLPSQYSSKESVEDAEKLAQNLGIEYKEIPINAIFKKTLDVLSPEFKKKEHDETEENLQARIRGNILMAFANKENRLVINTGNKSELALGYCTLYGDMVGAISVLGDVTKTGVYRLGHFINEKYHRIPARVFYKPPSAELRPDQTDQDNLPPYDQIDKVIEGYIIKHLSLEDISYWYHIPLSIVNQVVSLIFKGEYKRRQAPPALRVSSNAFGAGQHRPLHCSGTEPDIML
ncbi:MAG: Glutamine-dependent NAD(+) synthetase [Chlamydiia bacterium]|nr:Glutamine-dependent NAD(+) synthetase [Chlamydiia bacterium]